MVKDKLAAKLKQALQKIGIEKQDTDLLQSPTNPAFGDYASNIALKYGQKLKKNPLALASSIVSNLTKDELIEKVDIIKPGFINFWISKKYLISEVQKIAQNKFEFPQYSYGKAKKVMVEYAHPNTLKLFHIGHLRNIVTGESVARILEAVGNKVIRANYQGDVGMHIAKCLYKVKSQSANWRTKVKSLNELREKINSLGKAYAEGNKAYETDEKAKKDIVEINRMIYERNPEIMPVWQETRRWSLEYFDEIYARVYSQFDRFYFESEFAKKGTQIALSALKKAVLEKSDGAVIFNGKKYGLDTRVFINALGFPTYEGKELALAEKEFSEFGEIDKCIHVVSVEQTSFFKVTFKVEELLSPNKFKQKQYHLVYGWVRLKQGKMSSRTGNVVEGTWLLDETKKRIKDQFKCDDHTAEVLAVGAVKYSFLKNATQNDTVFDLAESISVEGNSAPYLIYTYVRTQSVLKKNQNNLSTEQFINEAMNDEEVSLLRTLHQYPETVENAAIYYSPNIITTHLFDLAQRYNLFYQKHPILKAEPAVRNFRLMLTRATAHVIKNGLYLLGIKTVERM